MPFCQAMQQMMFGDVQIPSAGRVRWLWWGAPRFAQIWGPQQLGFWVYIHDYTTQLYRYYNNDKDSLLTNQFHGEQQRCWTLLKDWNRRWFFWARRKAGIFAMFHHWGWLEHRHSLSIWTPLQWGFESSDVAREKRGRKYPEHKLFGRQSMWSESAWTWNTYLHDTLSSGVPDLQNVEPALS